MDAGHPQDRPDWFRGTVPGVLPFPTDAYLFTGQLALVDLSSVPVDPRFGVRNVLFQLADVRKSVVDVAEVRITSAWSRFEDCTFSGSRSSGERAPNARNSWALRPSLYRHCTFTGLELHGVDTGAATFDHCTFTHCSFQGLLSFTASYLACRFVGSLCGAMFATAFPEPGPDDPPVPARISGNDFTQAAIEDVRWIDVDLSAQRWPAGCTPVLSPWTARERRRDTWQEDWEHAVTVLHQEGWTTTVLAPAPVQVFGRLPTGEPYYFRARHTDVSLAIGGDDPADAPHWRRQLTYGAGSAASYLTPDDGLPLLRRLHRSWLINPDAP